MTAPPAEQPALDLAAYRALDDEERESIWQHGYSTGHAAALDARPPATCWVPVPITWRHVQSGDVVVGDGHELFAVESVGSRGATAALSLYGHPHPYTGDPDEPITVLVPIPERDAITLAADQLGARLIARRTEGAK